MAFYLLQINPPPHTFFFFESLGLLRKNFKALIYHPVRHLGVTTLAVNPDEEGGLEGSCS